MTIGEIFFITIVIRFCDQNRPVYTVYYIVWSEEALIDMLVDNDQNNFKKWCKAARLIAKSSNVTNGSIVY